MQKETLVTEFGEEFIVMPVHVTCIERGDEVSTVKGHGTHVDTTELSRRRAGLRTHEEVKDRHVDDIQESVAGVVGVHLLYGVAEERIDLPALGRHKQMQNDSETQ